MNINTKKPTLALIAHDKCKNDLVGWALYNKETLKNFNLIGTGTTGSLVSDALDINVSLMRSGPVGGDLQIGSRIVEGAIDMVVFFWDPLSSQPHDVDVKALLRIAVLEDIPIACNRATADHIISSPLNKYSEAADALLSLT